ncbi:hypothetical protein CK203_053233 [Vitis vinifera]|uniref:Retrotransposon gag domain-containing protein n=1 Tax=Vitis vinifera TaxID=29760 RepID=A0A438GJY2_VITVI|nr:hypothetical protein CK203_053233 [Vitis vinifera]
MSTPSRSRSSTREEEDNSEWRRAIERRQLASEQQLQAFLQETVRLREENVVLRIQTSSTGPPRHQHSRGQVANSRPDPESIYLGATGAILEACNNVLPHRDPMVTPMAQNVLPHRDPMVTPMVQNVQPHLVGQTLSWFHRLPPNSIDSFRDLSEAFVGQYLCSARQKTNISTLQNIKMQDNGSLREFVKRFGQAVLQVEACSMDAVLQIFKRSICPGTPFFESLAKKPPTTMDDLFRRANKYSMLKDNVRAATHQVLVVGQASRSGAERNVKLPDLPRPSNRRQEGPSRLKMPPLTPLSISYEKLLPMIQDMSDFRCLHYLVERLIKAGHLKQYLRWDARGRDASRNPNSGAPRAPAAPKVVINYINGGLFDEEYDSKRKRQRLLRATLVRERVNSIRLGITRGPRPTDGTIIFPPVDPTWILQPHRDALILFLEIGDFEVRRILVDPGSSADLVQASVVSHMGHSLTSLENPRRILSGFNGASTTSLGDIVLPVQASPVTLNIQFSVVQDLSPFNVILGCTWLHYMKVIPSTYHQMVSFLTKDGQIDLYGS